jgi:preprotein translocase SecE subunit
MATKDEEKAARRAQQEPEKPEQTSTDASFSELAEDSPTDDGLPDRFKSTADWAWHTKWGPSEYVYVAFVGAGILLAYLSGKILAAIWTRLGEWPTAVQYVPQLLRYAEDERDTITMVAGVLIGVLVMIRTFHKEHIRRFVAQVAMELTLVTWPNKEAVVNGTIVVVVASAVAAAYIALLDRLWAFVTTLVYGV